MTTADGGAASLVVAPVADLDAVRPAAAPMRAAAPGVGLLAARGVRARRPE